MYIVRNSNNDIVLISTELSDAEAYIFSGRIDGQEYTLEDTLLDQKFLEIQDGYGEGQPM